MRATLPPLVLALAALGCGETLIDHESPLADPPVLSVCDVSACPAPDPILIGTPVRACVGSGSEQSCGYECQDGLLKCAQGCCQAKAVAAGARHTCAIAASPADGDLYCWGANEAGQAAPDVSSGPNGVYAFPRLIRSGVSSVALGDAHTCAIVAGGAVTCWGLPDERLGGGTPIPADATAIAAGTAHTCAVVAGGVQCWGNAADGKLGVGGRPIAEGATDVAAGANHSCAIVAGGAVQCWGAGGLGQLGDDLLAGSAGPVTVSGIANARWVAARDDHTCAGLASAGDQSLRCWGNAPGLYASPSPQRVPAVPLRRIRGNEADPVVGAPVTLLGAGRAHACVQDGAAGAISCFGGNNGLGQLGAPLEPGDSSADIPITTGAASLAVGADHGCAVLPGGTVRCWGANNWGQLGDGSTIRPVVGDLVPISGR
jgi:hypothetical protein